MIKTDSGIQDGERPDFEIGLALAGAISAGAYTAGVIDFLIQALQEWESARPEGAPEHDVKLRTIAGASAGAITGALGVVALSRGIRPRCLTEEEIAGSHRNPGEPYQSLRCVIPTLYETWVKRPRMVAPPGTGKDLLGDDDIREARASVGNKAKVGVTVQSLLNAALLDEIKDHALAAPADDANAPVIRGPFPFLSTHMHIFMTVSNLRGIPFEVNFGNATYGMQTHGDRIHYCVQGIGSATWRREPWLAGDKWIDLHTDTLPNVPDDPQTDAWDSYGICALASAAFPGGLAPRKITTPFDQYNSRQYPLPIPIGQIRASFPASLKETTDYTFLNIDGGVINNNPFDYVQFALAGFPSASRSAGSEADRAVIMVAPFPEPPTFLPEGQPAPELLAVLRALFPTLINQARFRASELAPAMDPHDHSRFMISPRRSLEAGQNEHYAIACGLLGGFGGFLDERFRAHDFQLGRRNCQRFLATTFGLPPSSPVFANRSAAYRAYSLPARDMADGDGRKEDPAGQVADEFMIIPLLGNAAPQVALPHWPKMSGQDIRVLMQRIEGRIDAIKGPLIDAQTSKPNVRLIARLGLWAQLDRILAYLELTIIADLVRRNQIDGWDLPEQLQDKDDDVRKILAALVVPTRDTSTIGEIAGITLLHPDLVTRSLQILSAQPVGSPSRVVEISTKERSGFTLEMRRPRGIRAWKVLGPIIERFAPARYAY